MNKTLIADTIAAQMGGVRTLKLMLGATVYAQPDATAGTTPHLAVKWPNRERSRGNLMTVRLRGDDTYDVEFFNAAKLSRKSVAKFEGVYADQLVEIFERQTGWSLHVPKVVRV